jgi:flagellar motor protein MotB
MIRKSLLLLSLVVSSLSTSCTTRYQEMLVDRDARIRELSGDVARLRGENEELQRQAGSPRAKDAAAPGKSESSSLAKEVQDEVGPGAVVDYRKGRLSIGVQDSVTFDSGSVTLKDTSHKTLKNVAQVLKNKFGGKRFYIEGHTDSDPISKTKDKYGDNMDLSMQRAYAVRRYLISQGVSEASIVVVGYGQFDPRDAKAKAGNRRVEIVVGESLAP